MIFNGVKVYKSWIILNNVAMYSYDFSCGLVVTKFLKYMLRIQLRG